MVSQCKTCKVQICGECQQTIQGDPAAKELKGCVTVLILVILCSVLAVYIAYYLVYGCKQAGKQQYLLVDGQLVNVGNGGFKIEHLNPAEFGKPGVAVAGGGAGVAGMSLITVSGSNGHDEVLSLFLFQILAEGLTRLLVLLSVYSLCRNRCGECFETYDATKKHSVHCSKLS